MEWTNAHKFTSENSPQSQKTYLRVLYVVASDHFNLLVILVILKMYCNMLKGDFFLKEKEFKERKSLKKKRLKGGSSRGKKSHSEGAETAQSAQLSFPE